MDLTRTTGKLVQQQHAKPLLSPTRSLDEGFESDPDRVSSDSEHQATSGARSGGDGGNSCNSSNISSSTSSNCVHGGTLQQYGSNLAQLSSAAIGSGSCGVTLDENSAYVTTTANTTTSTTHTILGTLTIGKQKTIDLHKRRLLSMMSAPAAISRRQMSGSQLQHQNQNQPQIRNPHNSKNNHKAPIMREQFPHPQVQQSKQLIPTTTICQQLKQKSQRPTSSKQQQLQQQQQHQRLQYQKQCKTVVSSSVGLQSKHNQRLTATDFRRPRPLAQSSCLSIFHQNDHVHHGAHDPVTNTRLHSLENAARFRNTAVVTPTSPSNCMINYKIPKKNQNTSTSIDSNATTSGQPLLVQPISSVTLTSVTNATLHPDTAVLNSVGVGDVASAFGAPAGGSPVIASTTNSLYTFYPAEGNLQVWQSDCGDITYKSSRQQHPQKTSLSWTESMPRQLRR